MADPMATAMASTHDLIIIGGGPAGYSAAIKAGKAGLRTLLIEKHAIGGVCLNEGCIPTKALLYSAKRKDDALYGAKYGIHTADIQMNHAEVLARKDQVVATLVGGVQAQLKNARVQTVSGEAEIIGPVVIDSQAALGSQTSQGFAVQVSGETYASGNLLIATGSQAAIPPIPGLQAAIQAGIAVTSREMLSLQDVPNQLVVIGGGVIGLELASYYRSAGSEVLVIELLDQVGGPIDADIAKLLKWHLEQKGIKFFLGSRVQQVDGQTVTFQNSSGSLQTVSASKILVCTGRRARSQGLGAGRLGLALDHGGAVKTDERMMTNIPGIYAAGDCNGRSMLAHTAYREADVALNNILGHEDTMSYRAIPGVIYTNPEVADIGETEESAKAKGLPYRVLKTSLNFAGRYVAENTSRPGFVKFILDPESETVLGLHVIGPYVSEIIYGLSLIIEKRINLSEIKKTIFPHPTIGEIIREALDQID